MKSDLFFQQFPISLNEQQKEAVRTVKGPVLLLAVPGSGKTTVLVARLGYMTQCCNIRPERILTVTYTVAAAKDMARRYEHFFGTEKAANMEFRTINGICARIIAYYSRRSGKQAFRLVSDERQTAAMLTRIWQSVQSDHPTETDLKNVRTWITYIKNMMLTGEEIEALDGRLNIRISGIYSEYNRQLRQQGLMDYDDQMVYAYTMLRKIPGLLEYMQGLYPYICVDEAQDTSKIQHAIISLLAAKTENLFMVGDEDQSIYGFRAAYPKALLEFENEHSGARTLLMEQNFRSGEEIVAAADRFIQKNELRHKKEMKAFRGKGAVIRRVSLKSRRAQYNYLLRVAQEVNGQTAVLYRNNESAIPLVDLLDRENVPFGIRNGELSFFTHRTVLDISNIIRVALEPRDEEAFLQIYYKMGMYIRREDALYAAEICRDQGISVFDALLKYCDLDPRIRANVISVRTHLGSMLHERADRAVGRIVRQMGYGEYLSRGGAKDSKIYILQTIGAKEDSPAGLLRRLEELKELFRRPQPAREAEFILSTIHASKGLEYENVWLMDIADGIFPEEVPEHPETLKLRERENYEEERRLFYVGVTRAKNQLNIFTFGEGSVLVDELLPEKTAVKKADAVSVKPSRIFSFTKARQTGRSRISVSDDELDAFREKFRAGMAVIHKKYGRGVITDLSADRMRICFSETAGEKSFHLKTLCANGQLRPDEDMA